FQFVLGAVFRRVGHGMPFITVGTHFEKRGPVATPCALYGFVHRVVYRYHIHAIYRCTGHIETEAHLINVNHVGCAAYRRTHGVAVVFTHENNRKLPQHRHVEGFVERPLPYGTITHIAHIHVVYAVILLRKRNTSAECDLPTDDTVP